MCGHRPGPNGVKEKTRPLEGAPADPSAVQVGDVDLTSYRAASRPPGPSVEEDDAPLPTVEGLARRIADRLPGHLEIRVPILIALAVLLMSWMQKHLQWSVPAMLKVGTAALVGSPLLLSMAERLYRRHRRQIEEGVVTVAVQYLGLLLQTWVLAVLFVLALVPNLFFSSVTVLAAGVPGKRTVELRAVDESAAPAALPVLDENSTAHTFRLFTTPFGRSFVLKVTGYQHQPFTLYPGIGREFQVASLPPAPAVLVRLPPESHLSVNDDGEVRVFRREGSGELTLLGAVPTRSYYGSYLFGEFKGRTRDLEAGWSEDLAANEDLSSSALAVASDAWPTVKWIWRRSIRTGFLPGREPMPGDLLEVFHLAHAGEGTLSGRAAFVVTEDPVQDHMLLQLSEENVAQIRSQHPQLFEAVTGPLPAEADR